MADKLTLDRQAMKNRATAHLRIYVGGLTEKATVDELYEHFISYGQINGIVINRNFGFIQFENESSVQDAISKADGSVFQQKTLNVRPAQTTNKQRETETVTIQPDVSPAVALPTVDLASNENDEPYDNYGNYIGDQQNYREDEEQEDGYNERWKEGVRGRGRGMPRGRGVRGRGRGAAPAPYRERSPVGGPPREQEEGYNECWKEGVRGRGRGVRGRGREAAPAPYRERSPVGGPPRGPGEWPERGGYGYKPHAPEYPRAVPVTERNDCEIIVVSKALTEYAEYIENRLKRLGIVVDLLFPMEDVPIGKVLGNIASRGCLYAILVMPQNQENRSLTLTILHGLPQEHRNMPIEDALQLLSRNFQEVQRGGSSGREAVYALLGQLADGRALTALQYDKVIEYLKERREQQAKVELGEPLTPAPANKTQAELQQRILSILNDKTAPAPAPAPAPVPTPAAPAQSKLMNDPTVRKALDTILSKFT